MRTLHTVVLLILLIPSHALAWGREGHAIVAQIAESRLTPRAKEAVVALLGKETMASVGSWADTIRKDREETGPWHYVNIPYEMRTYDPARDGKNGENVIDKIVEFANALNDGKRTQQEREEALKFLIHFVGDLHQPLHCTSRNDDRGGNFVKVFCPGEREMTNLHRVWDTSIIKHILGKGDEKLTAEEYAAKLSAQITEKQAKEWTGGDPTAWANEAHKLAVDVAYAGLPNSDPEAPPFKLDDAYVERGKPVVELQLSRAGVRLAEVLNRIYR